MPTRRLALPLLLGLLWAACTPKPPEAASPTALPDVTVVRLTVTPLTPTTVPAPPTETTFPTPEPPCVNDLKFISDVTVPDFSQFLPGAPLVKKWAVENTGTCNWGVDYRLAMVDGDALDAPSEIALYPARAGTAATLEIPMLAPANLGQYASRWQARDPAGNNFGERFWVRIEVTTSPASTPAP